MKNNSRWLISEPDELAANRETLLRLVAAVQPPARDDPAGRWVPQEMWSSTIAEERRGRRPRSTGSLVEVKFGEPTMYTGRMAMKIDHPDRI
ncbi:hypothetical protein GWI33_005468 [Rhynchophorus ferrugineus]|uniref:Uncharacterized protein n=1 Tax=Rhynchophorus ferrugineus TaxID=354439 RepID=A0A834IHD5_RHYFE|nr:hypothetical protein GWI33_005468 [Rhynchophorus ferrugineus]